MFTLIACKTKNNIIGINNRIPWKQYTDMQRFKSITYGHTVVLGRKTFESFNNKFLPGRQHIIITRDKELADEMNYGQTDNFCLLPNELADFISTYEHSSTEIFVIGGSEIYKLFMPVAKKMFITELQCNLEARDYGYNDHEISYFPEFSYKKWNRIAVDASKADLAKPDQYDAIYQTFYRDEY